MRCEYACYPPVGSPIFNTSLPTTHWRLPMRIFVLSAPPTNQSPGEYGSQAGSKAGRNRRASMIVGIALAIILLFLAAPALAQEPYRQPPKEVMDVLHARTTPLA